MELVLLIHFWRIERWRDFWRLWVESWVDVVAVVFGNGEGFVWFDESTAKGIEEISLNIQILSYRLIHTDTKEPNKETQPRNTPTKLLRSMPPQKVHLPSILRHAFFHSQPPITHHQPSTTFNLNFIPFFGFVVITPAGIGTSFGSAILISNVPQKTATRAFNSLRANFSPIQLLGPCKNVRFE